MKKNYLKPETESMLVNTKWALCQHGGTTQDNGGQVPNPPVPGPPAPQRVFF